MRSRDIMSFFSYWPCLRILLTYFSGYSQRHPLYLRG